MHGCVKPKLPSTSKPHLVTRALPCQLCRSSTRLLLLRALAPLRLHRLRAPARALLIARPCLLHLLIRPLPCCLPLRTRPRAPTTSTSSTHAGWRLRRSLALCWLGRSGGSPSSPTALSLLLLLLLLPLLLQLRRGRLLGGCELRSRSRCARLLLPAVRVGP